MRPLVMVMDGPITHTTRAVVAMDFAEWPPGAPGGRRRFDYGLVRGKPGGFAVRGRGEPGGVAFRGRSR
jgi:hypothetical protein